MKQQLAHCAQHMEPNRFQLFINLLYTRATGLGMLHHGGNAMIPSNPTMAHTGTPIDSIQDYGWLIMEQIHSWGKTFIATQICNSQNSRTLFDLIRDSLRPIPYKSPNQSFDPKSNLFLKK